MPAFVPEFVEQRVEVVIGVNNVIIRAARKRRKQSPS
jgi:hypothetical protein